jgi:hypothetical protein
VLGNNNNVSSTLAADLLGYTRQLLPVVEVGLQNNWSTMSGSGTFRTRVTGRVPSLPTTEQSMDIAWQEQQQVLQLDDILESD